MTGGFHATEFQTQNQATWNTLQAALAQRDLATKLHGGAFILVPVVVGRVTPEVFLGFLAGIFVFLALNSRHVLSAVRSLRLLQFDLYSAERVARKAMMDQEGVPADAVYFSTLISDPRMRPLHQQGDPMGRTVLYTLRLYQVDVFGAVLLSSGSLLVNPFGPSGSFRDALLPLPVAVGVSVATAALAAWLATREAHSGIRDEEQRLSDAVVERYAKLGIAPGS